MYFNTSCMFISLFKITNPRCNVFWSAGDITECLPYSYVAPVHTVTQWAASFMNSAVSSLV